jgi:hypothetical protein
MKPMRTLLVVINKKVEWGILSVADIAVKRVIFRLHRSSGPSGTGLAACGALDYVPLVLDQVAVYMAALGAGVGRLSAPIGLTRSFWIRSLPLPCTIASRGRSSHRVARFCRFCRSSRCFPRHRHRRERQAERSRSIY